MREVNRRDLIWYSLFVVFETLLAAATLTAGFSIIRTIGLVFNGVIIWAGFGVIGDALVKKSN